MALNAAHNRKLESPELLLHNLVETVKFLLDVCVFKHTVFYLFSGLQLLHSNVKAILSHGTRVNHYLIFSQPSFATFDNWLQNSLQDHSLLQFLQRDPERLKSFYHDWAFIRNQNLYQAFLDCLYVLATRDYDVLNRIPSFSVTKLHKKAFKMPANGIPVINESRNSSSNIQTTKVLSEDTRSIHSTHLQSVQAECINEAQILEAEITSSSSCSVPEFSYYGSPHSPSNFKQFESDPADNSNQGLADLPHDENIVASTSVSSVPFFVPSPPKSFLESGFKVQPTALGSFPLPQKGQSVASFLTSLSDTAMPELDRENAHFNVSEALISAFEGLKVKQWKDQVKRRQDEAKIQTMFGEVVPMSAPSKFGSSNSKKVFTRRAFQRPSYSETESEFDIKARPRRPAILKKKVKTESRLDSEGQTEGFLSTTDASPSLTSSSEDVASSSFSAEGIAMNLLRNIKMTDKHFADASELKWLVTESDAPQALLPMPKTWSTSESDTESLDKSMRLRGTTDWAPPRPQIIFTEQPPPSLSSLLKKARTLRCAGCGMRVDPKYANTFRYCHYLGRYFCTGCHSLRKARIPQRILHKWDFSPYYVSNFSSTLLDSLQSDPVYNVMAINPNLYRQKRMQNFKNLRIQLQYLAEYLRNCRAASALYEEFNKFPSYYTADVDLYSLEDLLNLRFGVGLPLKVKQLVADGIEHVLKCTLCHQLGFLCELCKRIDVIFPFQITRVSRCRNCSSCFHLKCFNPGVSDCPKCLRLSQRRNTLVEIEEPSSASVVFV